MQSSRNMSLLGLGHCVSFSLAYGVLGYLFESAQKKQHGDEVRVGPIELALCVSGVSATFVLTSSICSQRTRDTLRTALQLACRTPDGDWLAFATASSITGLTNICAVAAVRQSSAGETLAVIEVFNTLLALITARVAFGESLSLAQVCACVVALVGVVLITRPLHSGGGMSMLTMTLAMTVSLGFLISDVGIRVLRDKVTVEVLSAARFVVGTLIAALIYLAMLAADSAHLQKGSFTKMTVRQLSLCCFAVGVTNFLCVYSLNCALATVPFYLFQMTGAVSMTISFALHCIFDKPFKSTITYVGATTILLSFGFLSAVPWLKDDDKNMIAFESETQPFENESDSDELISSASANKTYCTFLQESNC